MTKMTPELERYFEGVIKPYVEGVYSILEAELDHWNSDEVQALRERPRRYETVGDMLRLKKVAAIGSFEVLLQSDKIIELAEQSDVHGENSGMYIDVVKEVFASHIDIRGLTFTFWPNAGVLVKKT